MNNIQERLMLAGYSAPTGMKSASKLVKRPYGQCGCMRPELGEVWKFHVPSFTFWTDLELKNMWKRGVSTEFNHETENL